MTDAANNSFGQPATVLQLSGITKRFGALTANDNISLSLASGEIVALLGENGAGKSTLVSILFGHYSADAGSITAFGEPLPPGDPAAALARGIGMVHQHFALADNLTVQENIVAGTRSLLSLRMKSVQAHRDITETAQQFGLWIDPNAKVADLSVGERQRVEILKALYRGARILILDEPTAVLTPQESESLFDTLEQLVAKGLSIIFISHKLDEVMRVSDRIAVLRAGKLIANLPRGEASRDQLAELMVGRQVEKVTRSRSDILAKQSKTANAPIRCALLNGRVRDANRPGHFALNGISLNVRAGEIFGIAGVSGNGQKTLADVLSGMQPLSDGTLSIDGQAIDMNPRAFNAAGVARVPEDRHHTGVVGELSIWENAILERYQTAEFSLLGWLRRGKARRHTRAIVEAFDVRGLQDRGLSTTARSLSGGNMQKLILGRALSTGNQHPSLIVANQPTWGLDVGAVAFVHEQLLQAAQSGSAIVLISEDLDELFAIASTIAVMHNGQLTAPQAPGLWTMQSIGSAMAGTVSS